jgi:hypothetical protein
VGVRNNLDFSHIFDYRMFLAVALGAEDDGQPDQSKWRFLRRTLAEELNRNGKGAQTNGQEAGFTLKGVKRVHPEGFSLKGR